MSQLKGSEYKEIVKRVFTSVKSDGTEIKTRFVNEVDPIVQGSAKFQSKNPQMSKTTKEYFECTGPKNERLHRKVDYQKTNIFFENQEDTKPRPKKKVINENFGQDKDKEQKTGIKIVANSTANGNPIEHTANSSLQSLRLAKKHSHRPSDNNSLLQLPSGSEGRQTQTEKQHFNPSFNSNQIFHEASKAKADLNSNQYSYDKYSAFKTDHVVGIFNSKINEGVKEQKITQKPNSDCYSTFVNGAREMCYDRYQNYY